MAVAGEAVTRKNRGKNYWFWMRRLEDTLVIPPTGDVVVREPREGWSPGFYEAVLQRYVAVRGTSPQTARMHPSTALAVAPAERVAPVSWPSYEIRRHYAPARIILSDDAPQPPEH
jgi:hypothetical protein